MSHQIERTNLFLLALCYCQVNQSIPEYGIARIHLEKFRFHKIQGTTLIIGMCQLYMIYMQHFTK